jgi:hypothetical protein
MPRLLPCLAAALLLASCGMSPAEREEYLERTVTVRAAHLSARGDSGLLPWVQAEARGGPELIALRIRVYDDRNGDGLPQDAEYTGIARVREATESGEVLLRISTLTFKSGLLRPILVCEVDTSEGLHEQILLLE